MPKIKRRFNKKTLKRKSFKRRKTLKRKSLKKRNYKGGFIRDKTKTLVGGKRKKLKRSYRSSCSGNKELGYGGNNSHTHKGGHRDISENMRGTKTHEPN